MPLLQSINGRTAMCRRAVLLDQYVGTQFLVIVFPFIRLSSSSSTQRMVGRAHGLDIIVSARRNGSMIGREIGDRWLACALSPAANQNVYNFPQSRQSRHGLRGRVGRSFMLLVLRIEIRYETVGRQ